MNQENTTKLITLGIAILFAGFAIYKSGLDSCKNYLLTSYLYILLGILLIMFAVVGLDSVGYIPRFSMMFIAFIVSIVCIFAFQFVDPRNVMLAHLIWLLFLMSLAVNMYVIYKYEETRGTLTATLLITSVLVAVLALFAFYRPDLISLSWGSALLVALLIGIGMELLSFFIPINQKWLSAFFIFIFSLLILYESKILRVRSLNCLVPSYPKDSIGMILNIVNIFSGVGGIQ